MPNNDYVKREDIYPAVTEIAKEIVFGSQDDDKVVDIINSIPAADVEPKQRWISVTEDTPRSMVNKVLVFCPGDGECVPDYVGFAHFEKYHGEEIWYNLETGKPFEEWGLVVTNWMDKPLPPKRG